MAHHLQGSQTSCESHLVVDVSRRLVEAGRAKSGAGALTFHVHELVRRSCVLLTCLAVLTSENKLAQTWLDSIVILGALPFPKVPT